MTDPKQLRDFERQCAASVRWTMLLCAIGALLILALPLHLLFKYLCSKGIWPY
jgi:hypothetical protein